MILSVSRRTDIPAFYSEWFLNRIKEGYLLVRNPINYHQVSRVNLNPEFIDCIVFWTKNPAPMINKLHLLKDYNYYFQFTLNPYDRSIEKNLPEKSEISKTFIRLSEKLGPDRVIWRYDPIMLTDKFNPDYHYQCFDSLAQKLKNQTKKCVISFLDLYNKTERNLKSVKLLPISQDNTKEMASNLVNIAEKYNLTMETCSEQTDLSFLGIRSGKCIDNQLISQLVEAPLKMKKDKNQREFCGCIASIDIGTYNTCKHDCLYCYANFSKTKVTNNCLKYDKNSPLLVGSLEPKDVIKAKKKPCN